MSTVVMELYLGSVIEPIQKCIRNSLYFNSKHTPKTLGEAMQKAHDLHIKHLYALGEDQQDSSSSITSSTDALPEIMVNEVNTRETRRWHRDRCETSDYLQNSWEQQRQYGYQKRQTFNQQHKAQAEQNSESRDYSQNSPTEGQTEVLSTTKCDPWFIYPDYGESYAVRRL